MCRSKKGSEIGALLLCLVIAVDHGLAAITVGVFLLDDGRAVPRLSLLDHGGMITITVAVLIMRLTNRYASADRTGANTATMVRVNFSRT